MRRRNSLVLLFIIILAALALWAVATPDIKVPLLGERKGLRLGLDLRGGTHLVLEADLSQIGPGENPEDAVKGAMGIIERRVDAYGVTEPVIQRQPGGNRILVQLPGVKDIDEAVRLIGKTAQLEFYEPKLDERGEQLRDKEGKLQWIPAKAKDSREQEVALTGKYLKRNAFVDIQQTTNEPLVHFEWDKEGAILFEQITTRLVGKPLGIFLDNELVSYPTVKSVIKDKGVIEGLTIDEARLLSIQLNAGALPVPLKIVQQQDVDAILGADSLKKSLLAGEIGIALTLLLMLLYYRLPGLLADIALLIYGVLMLAIFKVVPVTLTLAGIAGFLISIGMAVDANVLIFERLKEELRAGRTLGAAVEAGFERAWSAIFDSNITTLIACGVLYWFGSRFGASAVMGFAFTLAIGVVVSMLSAVFISRTFLRAILGTPLAGKTALFRVLGKGEKSV